MAERFSTGLRNTILKASGSSLADALANGVIYLYSGTQPATADATEGTATKLVEISVASVAYVPSTGANGLNMDVAASGIVSKATGEVWSGVNLADGTIGWGRFYGNADPVVTGVSTTAIRFDFAVSQGGITELSAGSTSVLASGTTTISTFTVTCPAG